MLNLKFLEIIKGAGSVLRPTTVYSYLFFREYIVYIVPILMLLFIGSLIVALICVKVRNCNFESLSLTGSRSTVPTTTTNSNGNLRVEMPRGTVYIFILGQLFTYSIPSCKGQLISEWLFGVFNFPTNQRKNLINFCPRI